jgi:uncharacterized protein with HEPN domain
MSRDDAIVLDILKAAQFATEFTGDMDKQAFAADAKTQSSVIYQLLLIGEAVKRLSDDFRAAHPEIDWKRIAGMRDVLIHRYDDTDLDEVWKTVQTEAPRLARQLQGLAPKKP